MLMGRTRIRSGSCLPLVIGHSQGFEETHVNSLEILKIGIFIAQAVEDTIGACCGFLPQILFLSFFGYREASP
jgi:hypothetical protein